MCRLGALHPGKRWVSGSYLLINPTAQSLGGAQVKVKVSGDDTCPGVLPVAG